MCSAPCVAKVVKGAQAAADVRDHSEIIITASRRWKSGKATTRGADKMRTTAPSTFTGKWSLVSHNRQHF
jgi:hypothetical protein